MRNRTVELDNEEATIVILALEAYNPGAAYRSESATEQAARRRARTKALDLANRVRIA